MKKRLLIFLILFSIILSQNIYGSPDDFDDDGEINEEDCRPYDPKINSNAKEICKDGIDNDCDGVADRKDFDCFETYKTDEVFPTRGESVNGESNSNGDSGFSLLYIIIPIVLVVIVLAIIFVMKRRNVNVKLEKPIKTQPRKAPIMLDLEEQNLRKYVEAALNKGFSKEIIINQLRKKGWTDNKIRHVFRSLGK